jgi:glycerol kinase
LAVGFWGSLDEIRQQWQAERVFEPMAEAEDVEQKIEGWHDAVRRTLKSY